MSAAAGFADAVRVRVAFFLGQEDMAAARQSARIALVLAAGATFAACLVLWLFPEALVSVFLSREDADNVEVLAIAISLSAAAGVFLLLDGTQMVLASALRGLRDTKTPLWVSLIGYWAMGLGGGVLLGFGLGYGAIGLWWGLALGVVLCNGLLAWRLRARFANALRAPGPEGTMA